MSLIRSFQNEESVTTRPSYTAEFLVNSADRLKPDDPTTLLNPQSATRFTLGNGVASSQGASTSNGYAIGYGGAASLYNGVFNRLALTEVDMQWGVENVSAELWGNATIEFSVSVGGGAFDDYIINIPGGFYNVAECLQQIVFELNTTIGTSEFYIIPPGGYINGSSLLGSGQCLLAMKTAGSVFAVLPGSPLAQQLSLPSLLFSQFASIVRPNLAPINYIDFVCRQLTDNMSLKDGNTTNQSTPVLTRWYFSPDSDQYDAFGYKILEQYAPFTARRAFPSPKEMRWDPKMPIGQLTFEVRLPVNWRPGSGTELDANNLWTYYYTTDPPFQDNGQVLNLDLVNDEGGEDEQNPYSSPIFGFQMRFLAAEQ
jgi:hypothetical protein